MEKRPVMIKILAIDGGGVRGIIPAMVLAEIERRTQKPIAKIFNLIAGTSTGGILALGLTTPAPDGLPKFSATEGIKFYTENTPEIFRFSLAQQLASLNGLIEEKYSASRLEQILKELYGTALLSESLTNVIVTSYDIERREAFFFKSHHAKLDSNDDFFIRDIARATSAAPAIFEPAVIQNYTNSTNYALIDGGVYANNPAMCAFAEARGLFKDDSKFMLVSLGTGEMTTAISYKQAKGWGTAQWLIPILSVISDGVSDTVNYQLRKLLPAIDQPLERYYRLQLTLSMGDALDNASPANLAALQQLARDWITDHNDMLASITSQLMEDNT